MNSITRGIWKLQLAVMSQIMLRRFATQVDGFSQAAASNTPRRTPGEMGLRDIRIIEAIYKSADAGGVTIKL